MRRSIHTALLVIAASLAGCASVPADSGCANERVGAMRLEPLERQNLRDKDELFPIEDGDTLRVRVDDLHAPGQRAELDLRVSERGTLAIPLAGDVWVRGMTAVRAREALVRALSLFLRAPTVTLEVTGYATHTVYVDGAVRTPGTHRLRRGVATSVPEAVALAGGVTGEAAPTVLLSRATGEHVLIDLADDAPTRSNPVEVAAGDRIFVGRTQDVWVVGAVYRPGAYRLSRATTAAELVATAGGPIPRTAAFQRTVVHRRTADGSVERTVFDLDRVFAGKAPDVTLVAGDVVVMPVDEAFGAWDPDTWEYPKSRVRESSKSRLGAAVPGSK